MPDTVVTLEVVQAMADEAEQWLRRQHRQAVKGKLPDDMEHELTRLPRTSVRHCIGRYALCQHWMKTSVAETEKAPAPESKGALMALLSRHPLQFQATNGKLATIRTKSFEGYERMATLWHATLTVAKRIADCEQRFRLIDHFHVRRLRAFRVQLMNELLGVALHQDATPPADATPPKGLTASDLTHEDIVAVFFAHVKAGPGLFQTAFPASEDGDESGTGFGTFFSMLAKQRGVPIEHILREDVYAMMAQVSASVEGAAPDDEGENKLFADLGFGELL